MKHCTGREPDHSHGGDGGVCTLPGYPAETANGFTTMPAVSYGPEAEQR